MLDPHRMRSLEQADPEPTRLRRTRQHAGLRRLVRETRLDAAQLVQPIFVEEGLARPTPVPSMPGVRRLGLEHLAQEAQELTGLGVGAAIVFGIPAVKDTQGSASHDANGIASQAIRALKRAAPDLVVIGDVCLCEYTSHGHCGVLKGGDVDNDATLPLLARTAVAQAAAGADIVAPSAMMDGQVAAIRGALDANGHKGVATLSYSAKYASAFYGPFRDAASSAPSGGHRRGYQMDVANVREAMREIEADVREGADMVLVKPALPSLDVLRLARDRFDVPIGAYQVSGEFSMIKAAAANGWLNEANARDEALAAIRRAGADFIVTYFAKAFAQEAHA